MPADKYDEQIKFLTEHPNRIGCHWDEGRGLFGFASPDGHGYNSNPNQLDYGCLTMLRRTEKHIACTPELTARIRADERIPKRASEITVEHLPVFAEYQREIDAMYPERDTFDR